MLDEVVWNTIGWVSLAILLSIIMTAKFRLRRFPKCPYCFRRHPSRGPQQTIMEFLRTYCDKNLL